MTDSLEQRVRRARHAVVRASLRLAAADWAGVESADASMDLDYAHDQLDEALAEYVEAVEEWHQ